MDIVAKLRSLDRNATIYVAEPWTLRSEAEVELEDHADPLIERGLKYFIEVSIADDFVSDWESNLDISPSLNDVCERLIRYAVTDA
jgi:hypothetical protein